MPINPSRVYITGLFGRTDGEFSELKFDKNRKPDLATRLMKDYLNKLKSGQSVNVEDIKKDLTQVDSNQEYENFLTAFFEYFNDPKNQIIKKKGEGDEYHDSYETYIKFFISNPQHSKYILNDMNFVVRLLEESLQIKIKDLSEEIKKNPGLSETLLQHHIDNLDWYTSMFYSETLQTIPTLFILSLLAGAFVGVAALTSFSGFTGIACLVIAALIEAGIFANLLAHLDMSLKSIIGYENSDFTQKVSTGIQVQIPILATQAHEEGHCEPGDGVELVTSGPDYHC